jgi:hypothetical protein
LLLFLDCSLMFLFLNHSLVLLFPNCSWTITPLHPGALELLLVVPTFWIFYSCNWLFHFDLVSFGFYNRMITRNELKRIQDGASMNAPNRNLVF